jgi:hypothetical protein
MKTLSNRRVRPSLLVAAAGVALGVSASGALAQVSWTTAVSDSWFTNARWSGGAYPNSSATNAAISVAGTYTVSLQNGSASCGTLAIGNANATLNVFDNSALFVYGNITNSGLIQIGAPASPGNGTHLDAAAPITISGTGTLRLAATSSSGDSQSAYLYHNGSGANTITNSAGHTIAGYGQIYTGIINNGTVNADVNTKTLLFIQQPPTNNATMKATNGGALQFRGVALTQGSSGVCLSSNSSPIQFSSASVSGGTLNGAGTSAGIQYYGTNSVNGVTMSNLNAVNDNSNVHIGASGVVNNGTWTVSDPAAAGNGTHVDADTPTSITGTGTLRLQATSSNGDSDSAYLYHNGNGANTLTNGASHSIKGYGRIYVALTNNGTVNADITNKGLFFIQQAATNNGTMTASNGGFIQFRGVTVNGNPAAQIISTDAASPIQMVNATMSGGGFTTSGTGIFQYYGSNTLSNLTVNGTHQITDNSNVHLATNLVNNGTWKISDPAAAGNGTHLDVNASVSITGTGSIILQQNASSNGDSDGAYIYHNGNGSNTLTLGSGQTISGYGRIYTNVINNGTINANNTPNASGPTSKGIFLMQQDKTNNTTITSSNGGFWYIRGITLTNNGTLSSTNTSVPGGGFESCTVNGGNITNVSNQGFGTSGTCAINGSTITPGSVVQVNDNTTLNSSGITNNGTIFVNTPSGAGNGTRFQSTAPGVALSGTGLLRLQATSGNGDSDSAYLYNNGSGANTLVQAATHSIKGYGRIYVNLINNGTVNADISGKGLFFLQDAKTNNATITSSNSGSWYLRGTTITNGASGVMSSSNTTTPGGGIENSAIVGGTLTNVSNQYFGTAGTATLDGVTITPGSGVQVNDNSTLSLGAGGIVNNGTIAVDSVGAPGNTARLLASVPATISGTGTIRMNATGFGNDSSYMWGNGVLLTLASGQTLSGTGRLYGNITVNGVISPDQPFGTPTIYGSLQPLSGAFTYGSTSTFNCQIGTNTSYDSMQGNSAITINSGATLNIAFQPSYVPNSGDLFDLVVGGSVTGKFTTVNITGLGSYAGGPAHLVYLPDRVRLVMCYANADGSNTAPTLTAADFTAFLAAFRAGDAYANCDGSTGSPSLTAADFTCFLTKFRTGCN